MSNITRAQAIEMLEFDLNDLDQLIWKPMTDSLEQSCFLLRFSNGGSTTVYISYDRGTTIHDVVLPDNVVPIEFQNNASYSEKNNNMAKGTPIWICGTPNDANFYISGYTYVK